MAPAKPTFGLPERRAAPNNYPQVLCSYMSVVKHLLQCYIFTILCSKQLLFCKTTRKNKKRELKIFYNPRLYKKLTNLLIDDSRNVTNV